MFPTATRESAPPRHAQGAAHPTGLLVAYTMSPPCIGPSTLMSHLYSSKRSMCGGKKRVQHMASRSSCCCEHRRCGGSGSACRYVEAVCRLGTGLQRPGLDRRPHVEVPEHELRLARERARLIYRRIVLLEVELAVESTELFDGLGYLLRLLGSLGAHRRLCSAGAGAGFSRQCVCVCVHAINMVVFQEYV